MYIVTKVYPEISYSFLGMLKMNSPTHRENAFSEIYLVDMFQMMMTTVSGRNMSTK
jgi:hypothetical protein